MKWVGTIMNFFLPGLGYAIAGPPEKRLTGAIMGAAMIVLSWVEVSIKTAAPDFYWPMFAAVFVFNTAFAVDSFRVLSAK